MASFAAYERRAVKLTFESFCYWPGAETQSWGVNLIYTLTWRQIIR